MKAVSLAAIVLFSGAAVQQEQVYKPGPGVTNPEIVKDVKPRYTSSAMQAKVQGEVLLEGIVGLDGRVSAVKVVKSLDNVHGLDDEAVEAFSKWVFKPGMRAGKPVPVQVQVVLTFTLREEWIFDASNREVKAPVLVSDRKPAYTPETLRKKIEGVVELEGVVKIDGTVGEIRVVKGIDPALDAKAIEAFEAYTYKPAALGSRPVNYRLKVDIVFSLKN